MTANVRQSLSSTWTNFKSCKNFKTRNRVVLHVSEENNLGSTPDGWFGSTSKDGSGKLFHQIYQKARHVRTFWPLRRSYRIDCFCFKRFYIRRDTANLCKVRLLLTLSHRGSDNSPLLVVFKWTLYELCICIFRRDLDHSDSVFYTYCSVSEDDESRVFYVFVSPLACSLLRSKVQSFRNSFSYMKITFDWSK